jgi:hypothetical protein
LLDHAVVGTGPFRAVTKYRFIGRAKALGVGSVPGKNGRRRVDEFASHLRVVAGHHAKTPARPSFRFSLGTVTPRDLASRRFVISKVAMVIYVTTNNLSVGPGTRSAQPVPALAP